MTRRFLLTCLIAGLLAGCGGPVLIIPGGTLSGPLKPTPDTWQAVPDTIQVEFRPSRDPYSINIWGVGLGSDLYIATSADGTRWSVFLASDKDVRVRIDETLYALRAAPVSDTDERTRVLARYIEKYDLEIEDSWVETGLIYRLDRP